MHCKIDIKNSKRLIIENGVSNKQSHVANLCVAPRRCYLCISPPIKMGNTCSCSPCAFVRCRWVPPTPFARLIMAGPSNPMSPKSTCLPLDPKYSREDTKLCSSIEHTPRENLKIHIFHQDHKWENTAYNILKSYLTSLYYSNRILSQLIITAEYNNVIKVTEKAGLI